MHNLMHAGIVDIPRWYAIHTKPKQEDRADSNLRAWNVKTFTPKIREKRLNTFTGKPSYFIKPLFSRYIFAHFKASDLLYKVCFTRGVQNVVCFGGNPSSISDEIIELIQSRIDKDGFVCIEEESSPADSVVAELSPGDRVVIEKGYLKNFVGIFEGKVKNRDRVAILLTTISYQGRVVLEREWVRKAS